MKMARVLGASEMDEEARTPMLDAILAAARALAVENRIPEPASIDETIQPPLAFVWKEGIEALRAFVADSTGNWKTPLPTLETALTQKIGRYAF
jgi:hypothetical protein